MPVGEPATPSVYRMHRRSTHGGGRLSNPRWLLGCELPGRTAFYKVFLRPCLLLLLLALGGGASNFEFVDLSWPYEEGVTLMWPTATPYDVTYTDRGQKEKFYYETNDFCMSEHGGTHIDAPAHFAEGKNRVHDLDLNDLHGPAYVIDITAKADLDPDALLKIEDIESYENKHGRIDDGGVVLIRSGWGKRWPDKLLYLGTETNDTTILHFPGLDTDAARFLVDQRHIKVVGIDTASIDFGPSQEFPTHQELFKNNVPALENVANLEKLPAKGAYVFAAPMHIKDGSGAPTRVFAQIDAAHFINKAARFSLPKLHLIIAFFLFYQLAF